MIQGIENISRYIPQRAPMIMVDRIDEVTDSHCRAGLTVVDSNLFVADGCLTEAGLVEHIAQSAAAGLGVRCERAGTPVPLGFIASLKNLKIAALPVTGTVLTTDITTVHTVFDISIVNGTVYNGQQLLATCEMRIFTQS